MNVENRTLFIADNLDIMRGIDSECINSIYLNAPFNSKKQHKCLNSISAIRVDGDSSAHLPALYNRTVKE